LGAGYPEQSLVVTGLRGVGKTVLLGEYQKIAAEEGWVSAEAEVSKNTPFMHRYMDLDTESPPDR